MLNKSTLFLKKWKIELYLVGLLIYVVATGFYINSHKVNELSHIKNDIASSFILILDILYYFIGIMTLLSIIYDSINMYIDNCKNDLALNRLVLKCISSITIAMLIAICFIFIKATIDYGLIITYTSIPSILICYFLFKKIIKIDVLIRIISSFVIFTGCTLTAGAALLLIRKILKIYY